MPSRDIPKTRQNPDDLSCCVVGHRAENDMKTEPETVNIGKELNPEA